MIATVPKTMKAVVVSEPGTPSVLKVVKDHPVVMPNEEQVLIRIRAFGLNRSEMYTRQGHSPGVQFPRVLGIEAVGQVSACPGGQFAPGAIVATCMGGMGRDFDGGYAQYTCVPVANVQELYNGQRNNVVVNAAPPVPWEVLGALPEMSQTAYGSLMRGLQLKKADKILIRGGTSSVGLMAASMAKAHGAEVWASTRTVDAEKTELLRRNGVENVITDDGKVSEQLAAKGIQLDKVLELVGTRTLRDSLRCVRPGGIVCNTGILGNIWTLDEQDRNPMTLIPTGVFLTAYSGGPADFMQTPLKEIVKRVEDGMHVEIGRRFKLEEIQEAHEIMEANKAGGKIIVLVD